MEKLLSETRKRRDAALVEGTAASTKGQAAPNPDSTSLDALVQSVKRKSQDQKLEKKHGKRRRVAEN